MSRAVIPVPRALLKQLIQASIDLLDAAEAAATDREPDDEDEVVSEDDGLVRHWTDSVGRQA
ncbi:hypothetical protein [Brevundimonas sp.]|uniref:hypothetical protein n=1 Tax=Brevundimonas sp. TaxID=1871086 RepID=UPI00286B8556|nr:hypothetical protein [Brevundimonas sp.]